MKLRIALLLCLALFLGGGARRRWEIVPKMIHISWKTAWNLEFLAEKRG